MSSIKKNHFTFFVMLIFFIILCLTSQVNASESLSLPYYRTIEFKGYSIENNLNQTEPPLTIEYQVTPVWEKGKKPVCHNEDCSDFVLVDYERIAEKSWFLISAANSQTSEILAEEGFGKSYDINTKKSITIRKPGPYKITMSGNFATVTINIMSNNPNLNNVIQPVRTPSLPPGTSTSTTQEQIVPSTTITVSQTRIEPKPDSVPIWDRNNLTYLVLFVFVLLFGILMYDTYYKKKK